MLLKILAQMTTVQVSGIKWEKDTPEEYIDRTLQEIIRCTCVTSSFSLGDPVRVGSCTSYITHTTLRLTLAPGSPISINTSYDLH
jgi:hypothetical protein